MLVKSLFIILGCSSYHSLAISATKLDRTAMGVETQVVKYTTTTTRLTLGPYTADQRIKIHAAAKNGTSLDWSGRNSCTFNTPSGPRTYTCRDIEVTAGVGYATIDLPRNQTFQSTSFDVSSVFNVRGWNSTDDALWAALAADPGFAITIDDHPQVGVRIGTSADPGSLYHTGDVVPTQKHLVTYTPRISVAAPLSVDVAAIGLSSVARWGHTITSNIEGITPTVSVYVADTNTVTTSKVHVRQCTTDKTGRCDGDVVIDLKARHTGSFSIPATMTVTID